MKSKQQPIDGIQKSYLAQSITKNLLRDPLVPKCSTAIKTQITITLTKIMTFIIFFLPNIMQWVKNKLQLLVVIDLQLLLTTGGGIRNVELQKKVCL